MRQHRGSKRLLAQRAKILTVMDVCPAVFLLRLFCPFFEQAVFDITADMTFSVFSNLWNDGTSLIAFSSRFRYLLFTTERSDWICKQGWLLADPFHVSSWRNVGANTPHQRRKWLSLHVGLMLITPHPILPYFLSDLDLDLPFNISNLDVGLCRILHAFPVQPVTPPKLIPLSWLQPALAVEAQFGLHLLFWYRCPSGGALWHNLVLAVWEFWLPCREQCNC